jgi:hypothetical protein
MSGANLLTMTAAAALVALSREGTTMKAARKLGIAAGLLGLVTSGVGDIEAQAEPPTNTLTLSVALDLSTFAFNDVSAPGGLQEGPFAVEGEIFLPEDCPASLCTPPAQPIGSFDGWGWIAIDANGNTVKEKASQVYTIGFDGGDAGVDLDEETAVDLVGGPASELGRIAVQGLEIQGTKGFLAIVGGTDDFTNVQGDAVMDFDVPRDGFDVTFRFTNAAAEAFSAK